MLEIKKICMLGGRQGAKVDISEEIQINDLIILSTKSDIVTRLPILKKKVTTAVKQNS